MAERVVNFRGGEQIVVPYSLDKIATSHNPRKPIRRLHPPGLRPAGVGPQPGSGRRPGQERRVRHAHGPGAGDRYPGPVHPEDRPVPAHRPSHLPCQGRPGRRGQQGLRAGGGVGAGERRVLACAYLEAERRIQTSKGETPNRDKPWTVDAICLDHITVEEAGEIGWDENDQLRQMTDLDYGERFDALLRQDNPLTEKPYTIQEVADKYGKNYHWVRGRAALPYLPVEMQQQVEDGTCNITEACNLALAARPRPSRKRRAQRMRIRVLHPPWRTWACPRAGAAEARRGAGRSPPTRRERRATLAVAGSPGPLRRHARSKRRTPEGVCRSHGSDAGTGGERLHHTQGSGRSEEGTVGRAACPQGRGGLSDLLHRSGHDHRAHRAGRR